MSPLGKRIIVFFMLWVLLVMVLLQVYDNIRGRGTFAAGPNMELTPTVFPITGTPDTGITQLADLQNCVASNPNNVDCTIRLAQLYYDLKQWPQAQTNFERAIMLQPHDANLLRKLAGTLIYQLKFDEALTTLDQALAIEPNGPELHLVRGLVLGKLNPPRTDEAVAEWRKVVELAPGTDLAQQATILIDETKP